MNKLLSESLATATAGVSLLHDALLNQGVSTQAVEWSPPLGGKDLHDVMADQRRSVANELALSKMLNSGAVLVDVKPASEALNLGRGEFLHAGPPIEWSRASGPMRGALIAAMLYEKMADSAEAAELILEKNGVALEPCHHRGAVGPMAGVVTPSMWMFELQDPSTGNKSWCSLNEGLGKVLRYGAYSPEVIERLDWMRDVLGPLLQVGVRAREEHIDVRAIISQMIQMGDEGHNRNRAG
ncbi:MAG: DUF1116 domain-containing protein, partial [Actinobacteria bacterium]|nr:DUF1116 domain-containing protein [Actinomycetota bacterium]